MDYWKEHGGKLSTLFQHLCQVFLQTLRCFAGSLFEWGAEHDCALAITRIRLKHLLSESRCYTRCTSTTSLRRGTVCTYAWLRWKNDSFTTVLRAALGKNAIGLPLSDALTLAPGQMYYLETLISAYRFMVSWRMHLARRILDDDGTSRMHQLSSASSSLTRLTTTSTRSSAKCARRRILQQTPCGTPHPPLMIAATHILLPQRRTRSTYTLFTDGSYSIPDLPPSAIL